MTAETAAVGGGGEKDYVEREREMGEKSLKEMRGGRGEFCIGKGEGDNPRVSCLLLFPFLFSLSHFQLLSSRSYSFILFFFPFSYSNFFLILI